MIIRMRFLGELNAIDGGCFSRISSGFAPSAFQMIAVMGVPDIHDFSSGAKIIYMPVGTTNGSKVVPKRRD